MQVSGIVSKRVINESAVLYSSRHSCNTAHSRSIWSMVRVWPQWWQVVGGPRDKIWDFVAYVWPIRSRVYVQLHPTWFEPAAGCRSWPVVSNLHSGHPPEDICHDQGSPSPAGQLFHFRLCHNGLVSSRNEYVCEKCWRFVFVVSYMYTRYVLW